MSQNTTTDTILDEIHRTRREMSDKFGGDFRLRLDDARRRQAASGRPVWQPNMANDSILPSSGDAVSGKGDVTPAAD